MPMPSFETLGAIIIFAAAASWTPGPNNVMLASSGATFGLSRTWPHIFGVTIGFSLMVFAIALGLGEVFRNEPALRIVISWTGFAVMLYLAYRIGTQSARPAKAAARPLSFWSAAAFQWVNPKAWVMTTAAAATYVSGQHPTMDAATIAVIFLLVGLTSTTTWAAAGASLAALLGRGWRLVAFNATMALLLALSALWLVIGG
ncbi:LysE family transporter [Acuticoccus sp. M5D2P5]|uniref:LysE family translocator n=1 Tax=Acuticoccus kalidii TaxID=2910977 RepID=UPI001F3BE3FE|nr:LysE family transporter [Acuticoccus kalidii]MCF3936406.1 LysE family transporter [Acuticoccus kalidii]